MKNIAPYIYTLLFILLSLPSIAQKTAETLPATNISAHCATLNGLIVGAQTEANLTFFIGTALNQPMQPTTWIKKTTTGDSAFSFDVCGLKCNTLYYFQFCSTGFSEFPCGSHLTFKTLDTAGCATVVGNVDKPVFSIYPNPVQNTLSVTAEGYNNYVLYNAIGSLVVSGSFRDKTNITTTALLAGIYIMHITNERGTFMQKVVKQ